MKILLIISRDADGPTRFTSNLADRLQKRMSEAFVQHYRWPVSSISKDGDPDVKMVVVDARLTSDGEMWNTRISELRQSFPAAKIYPISMSNPLTPEKGREMGADGFLNKGADDLEEEILALWESATEETSN